MTRHDIAPDNSETYGAVPFQLTTYFGRPSIEARIIETLRGNRRALTIVGPGGVGKTRLAQETARDSSLSSHFRIKFCDLNQTDASEDICEAIAASFDWILSPQRAAESLRFRLQNLGTSLLVLDNAENWAVALSELVPSLLSRCPALSILVTSRIPIEFEGEQTLWLPSLMDEVQVARDLFTDRAEQAGVILSESSQERKHIDSILEHLSYLPLAIELAASQLRLMNLSELEEQVRQRLMDLQRPSRGEEGSHSLRVCFDRSWCLLTLWEQAALPQLSIFPHPFTLNQAAGVIEVGNWPDAPDSKNIVQHLVIHSLLTKVEHPGRGTRFQMLKPIRQWASQKLEQQFSTSDHLELDNLSVDLTSGVVTLQDGECTLNDKERTLLQYLSTHPGVAVSRETLFKEVWGYSGDVVSRTIDTTMQTLRKTVDRGEWRYLRTVRGVGYQFADRPDQRSARLATQIRHGQWLLAQARPLHKKNTFSTDLTRFVADHIEDFRLAVLWAIGREDGKMVLDLVRHAQGHVIRLEEKVVETLADLIDLQDAGELRYLIRLLMAAKRYDKVLEYTKQPLSHGKTLDRFAINQLRGQACSVLGSREQAIHLYYELLSCSLPQHLNWVKLASQYQLTNALVDSGRHKDARQILADKNYPYAVGEGHELNRTLCQMNDGILMMAEGQNQRALALFESIEQKAKVAGYEHLPKCRLLLAEYYLAEAQVTGEFVTLEAFLALVDYAAQRYRKTGDLLSFTCCMALKGYGLTLAGSLDAARVVLDVAIQWMHEYEKLGEQKVRFLVDLSQCEWLIRQHSMRPFRQLMDRVRHRLEDDSTPRHVIWHRLLEARYGLHMADQMHVEKALNEAEQTLKSFGFHPDSFLCRQVQNVQQRCEKLNLD